MTDSDVRSNGWALTSGAATSREIHSVILEDYTEPMRGIRLALLRATHAAGAVTSMTSFGIEHSSSSAPCRVNNMKWTEVRVTSYKLQALWI